MLVVFDAKFELAGLMLVELDDKFEPGGLMLFELGAKFWFGRTFLEFVEDGLTVVPNGRIPGKRRYDNEHYLTVEDS